MRPGSETVTPTTFLANRGAETVPRPAPRDRGWEVMPGQHGSRVAGIRDSAVFCGRHEGGGRVLVQQRLWDEVLDYRASDRAPRLSFVDLEIGVPVPAFRSCGAG